MKTAELETQYARFPEINRAEVQKLVKWNHTQPHLPEISEAEALHFFHACHSSMEMAKKVLDTYFTARTHVLEIFGNLDSESPELKRAMNTVAICPLPQLTPEGYRVSVASLSDTNPSNYNFADTMKLNSMVFDYWVFEDGIRNGHIMVMDMKGSSLGHLARIGPLQMKKVLFFLQEAAPIRLVGFHFINTVPFMDKVLALINPFLKKELKNVFYLHSDLESFYEYVPKEILPKDYGGPEPEMNVLKEVYYEKLRQSRQEHLEFEKRIRVNEKLRPGKPKNESELFGIEGNFKKLEID